MPFPPQFFIKPKPVKPRQLRVCGAKKKVSWSLKPHTCRLPHGHKGLHLCGVGTCDSRWATVKVIKPPSR